VVLYQDQVHDPDLVWGYATLDLLGPVGIGLVGLMMACLMAALMSTADCLMITGAGLLTHNIYRPIFPNQPDAHYVKVGRICGAVVIIGGALIATQFDTILQQLKLWWELNVTVAASFWLGMKWRRANKVGAWCSILASSILFFGLSALLPAFIPSLQTNPALLKCTKPLAISRTYKASQMDVEQRNGQIQLWQALPEAQRQAVPKPGPLEVGKAYTKTFQQPGRSIFWTKGIKYDNQSRQYGSGMLNLELVLLDHLGIDLQSNPYALNETLRILIRTVAPFLILVLVSLITRPDDKDMLDRFYTKMRTAVSPNRQADAIQVAQALEGKAIGVRQKLFRNSSWEFHRWTRTDAWGFAISFLVAIAIITLLAAVLRIGR
jgi:SSS family solute:Na+ symporter